MKRYLSLVGERVRAVRKARRLSQEKLAELAELVDVPSARTNREMDRQIMEMLVDVRSLGRKNRSYFLAAARGVITGLKEH